ncbi:MAG: FG-GAP-like repeat-containing protein [Acidiferrobacterales bacterium]
MSTRISILCLFTLSTVLLAGCTYPAAISTHSTTADKLSHVQIAEQLIQSRQHKRAIALLNQHLDLYPESTDALFLSGRAYFAMAEYDRAAKFFRRVMVVSPQHIDARHRLWAARLQLDYSNIATKKTIRSEIQGLLGNNSISPIDVLTAYYGYRYLWDQPNQQRVLKKIAVQKLSNQLRERVADALVYEIITTRKKGIRTELAELYLDNFSGLADDVIAASWIFSNSVVNKNLRQLQTEIDKHTGTTLDNAAANLYAAYALIQNDFSLPTAISLLRTNLALYKQTAPGTFSRLELARNHRQLGIAYYKQNGFQSARKHFRQAQKLQPENGTAAYYLGRIAERSDDQNRAIKYYRKSLEADGRQIAAQSALVKLLEDDLVSKAPSRFFASQEKIVVFEDVTKSAGMGNVRSRRVAWGDYDNDGDDDLLVDGTRLFSNNKGIFTEVTDAMGIVRIRNATGGIWGDFNNDGYLDIFVTVNGTNRLLENIGGTYFRDVSARVLPENKAANSEAAAWGDYNGDGYPDLYIANYQLPAIERGICSHDSLLENIRGQKLIAANRFTLPQPDEAMCGRGITWGDFKVNGKPDIFVANYRLDPNFLWTNEGNRFLEKAVTENIAGTNNSGYYGNSIGAVFSDLDNDGRLDLFVTNLAHPRDRVFSDSSHLYLNSQGQFRDQYENSGIGYEETYSDPAVADVDNDGDVDLFLSAIYSSGRSHLFLNNGKARFRDVSWLSGTRLNNTWGSAFSDYDNDGDMDLIVASENGIRLLRNDGPNGNWIKIRLRSTRCNTFGVGARMEIRYPGHAQSRVITAGRGTGNQDSLTQMFGLGKYQGSIELRIKDGCGRSLGRTLPEVNRQYELDY